MQLVNVIVLLCQLNTGANTDGHLYRLEARQLECQQYYIKCLDRLGYFDSNLRNCVLKRNLDDTNMGK
jgi:hypothetical protein